MARPSTLLLIGAGGHAAVVAEAARAAGWSLVGVLDDDPAGLQVGDVTIAHRGLPAELHDVIAALEQPAVHVAIGANTLRSRWLDAAGDAIARPIVHPTAVVSPSATIEPGVFIGPGAIVNARAVIERGVIVNSHATVEHDCRVGACAHIAPGAVLAGAASVGTRALVGINASVCPGVRVGGNAILGAGGVAVKDVPDGAVAVGVPAVARSHLEA